MFTKFSKLPKNKNPNDISNFFKIPTFSDVLWYENYIKISRFRKKNFRFPRIIYQKKTKSNKLENSLGIWLRTQRNDFNNKTLSNERQLLLETLGCLETTSKNQSFLENQWLESYNKVLEFKKLHNRFPVQIPPSRQTYHTEALENSLGIWLSSQRQKFKLNSLDKNRIELLEHISFVWEGSKIPTLLMHTRLLAFLKLHKKLPKSIEHITENKILERILDDFTSNNLNDELTDLLKSLKYKEWIENKRKHLPWEVMCNNVKNFIQKFDKIPTFNAGVNSDYENQLSAWLAKQRHESRLGKLRLELQSKLVDLIGRLDHKSVIHEEIWEEKYNELIEYLKNNKCFPKLSIDKQNNKLANWLQNQIKWENGNFTKNGPYPIERRNKLTKIGVNFSKSKRARVGWNTQFEDLRFYMMENNNRSPSYNEKYSLNGHLGVWCFNQRQIYNSGKLKPEREEKLRTLGFDLKCNNENRTIGIKEYYKNEWIQNYDKVANLIKFNSLNKINEPKLNTWYLKNKKLYLNNKLEDWKRKLWNDIEIKQIELF